MSSFKIAMTAASLFGAVTVAPAASAAELTVIGSTAMKEVLEAVLPIFEHDSGHTEPGQRVGPLVANGQAEIGVQQITELLATPGIDFVGPLPQAVQTTIMYATARPTNAQEPAAANELVRFLSSKSVAPVARKMGLDPALR